LHDSDGFKHYFQFMIGRMIFWWFFYHYVDELFLVSLFFLFLLNSSFWYFYILLYLFSIFNFLVNKITNTIFFVSWFRYW
jgi:hypothetical protein